MKIKNKAVINIEKQSKEKIKKSQGKNIIYIYLFEVIWGIICLLFAYYLFVVHSGILCV